MVGEGITSKNCFAQNCGTFPHRAGAFIMHSSAQQGGLTSILKLYFSSGHFLRVLVKYQSESYRVMKEKLVMDVV